MHTTIDRLRNVLTIAGRVLLGLYFIVPGISKITGFEQTAAYMAEHNVPLIVPLLLLTIVLQVGGGTALVANFRTPVVAFVLAGLTLLISLFMHDFWNFAEGLERAHETQNFVKNMAIMAGLLTLVGGTASNIRSQA